MTEELKVKLIGKLITDNDIAKQLRVRKSDSYFESFVNGSALLNEKLSSGWQLNVELKTKTKVFKKKPEDIAFEDKVWSIFALLGFKLLNKDRHFHIPYDKKDPNLTHQIDVFAKDDETVLIVECKSAMKNKIGDFKQELEAMKSKKAGIINTISALFPLTKPKFKYILATSKLGISDNDVQRLASVEGIHFSEEIIDYYYLLHSQIGIAARYQLLGSLFAGQEIPDLENKIPAIEGKMGGHTYYSFSIEPEKLLKIGFVLHRNKANENMMPTYQRLIKKNRLKEIHTFIDEDKGYFPNSIIINIVSEKNKKLVFDQSNNQVPDAISRIGVLHLPKKYRSAYIIDGQHRLYGYSNSQYKSSNTIPVVALVNLDRSEQVKLFMQINENQKAVPKDLRNTLDADLLWDSDSRLDQLKALKSKIAINLGENRRSPFFGKISIGEDKRSITTEHINLAINRSDFLGKVKKFEIEKLGTFYTGDLDKAYLNISDFLFKCFGYLKDSLEDMWEQEGNIIVINKGFYAITLMLNDLLNHLFKNEDTKVVTNVKATFEEIKTYLDTIIHFYKDLTDAKTTELKTAYGTSGDAKYWRTLQSAMRINHPEIHYEGLDEYLKKEEKENNEKAFKLIREIENTFLKIRVREKLEEEFGKNWFKKGVPEKIYSDATLLAAKKNRDIEDEDDEKEPWDQLHLIDYREIILKTWQKLFEKTFTKPGEEKISGGKENKTKWMVELNRIRNENSHTYYVTGEELSFIEEIHDWLQG
ncbi:DGQHR domain-containing protein [Pedobacter cryoconitis]|uniref:DGQHR domain-containing protein n=1 Tax=Pedobacter cryoconitis TaxID=188932 RepID=UPI00161C40AE|nr:DGQHR domain-containing protein [Pedobacter cryoconitis]MBB5647648.1 DNA sulfur modification protein DndB [Pedobacter cryoconitis]